MPKVDSMLVLAQTDSSRQPSLKTMFRLEILSTFVSNLIMLEAHKEPSWMSWGG